MFFIIGFFWIFQIIVIEKNGIEVRFFKITLRKIEWNEVEGIEYDSIMRNPAYIIKVKNSKNLNIDSRKKIKKALKYYGTKSIENMIDNLQE